MGLGGKQFLLALDTPAVAGQAAVRADDSVTGNGDGDGIGSAGGSYGAGGGGGAEVACDGAVGAGFAAGDVLEGFPDALLEGGGADVEREGGGEGVFARLAEDEGEGFGEPAAVAFGGDELSLVEAGSEIGYELGIVAAEGDGADAAVGGGGEHAAKRAGRGGVLDDEAGATFAHRAGRHAEGGLAVLVETAGGAEAGVVDGFGDAGPRERPAAMGGADWLDTVLELLEALGPGELAGADAQDSAEAPEEGEAAGASGLGEVGEPGALGGVLGKILGGGGDDFGLGVGPRLGAVGLAAFAGAVAGGLGGVGRGEEADAFAGGATAGAAGLAVDLGRLDGVDELAVGGGVAPEDLLPLAAGEEAGDRRVGLIVHRFCSHGASVPGGCLKDTPERLFDVPPPRYLRPKVFKTRRLDLGYQRNVLHRKGLAAKYCIQKTYGSSGWYGLPLRG